MPHSEWPQPSIRFEDLWAVLELLGPDAERVLRGWVLVPAGWVRPQRPRVTSK
jgi:hypothetical protein